MPLKADIRYVFLIFVIDINIHLSKRHLELKLLVLLRLLGGGRFRSLLPLPFGLLSCHMFGQHVRQILLLQVTLLLAHLLLVSLGHCIVVHVQFGGIQRQLNHSLTLRNRGAASGGRRGACGHIGRCLAGSRRHVVDVCGAHHGCAYSIAAFLGQYLVQNGRLIAKTKEDELQERLQFLVITRWNLLFHFVLDLLLAKLNGVWCF